MKEGMYRSYLLHILMVILALNYVDRLVLGLVLQEIKVDLSLTDTQLGLLSGIAFAFFYSVMGIPIARWADRGNRIVIISLTAAAWSVGVALCGVATGFLDLLLIRVLVAVGEAGCIPPGLSLISDYFTRAERPRAVSRYMLGGPLSVALGYSLAGSLNQHFGWRVTFILLGVPGLAMAVLAWFTLREPRLRRPRSRTLGIRVAPGSATPTDARSICKTLWRNRTFRHLLFSVSGLWFFAYGVLLWQPTFFIRSYGLSTAELGLWLTGIWAIAGTAGTYLGGEFASRFAPSDERLQLRFMTLLVVSFGALSGAIYITQNLYAAFGFMALGAFGINLIYGPLFAMLQALVPEPMRAVSVAVTYLFANLIGMGLGPLATGALSDALRPYFGEESLRYALISLSPGYLFCAWLLWRAGGSVIHDLQGVRDAQSGVIDEQPCRA